MVREALNTTDCPLQIVVPRFELMITDGLLELTTKIVIGVEVTTDGFPQGFEIVIVTVTTSPLFKVELTKVLLFIPTLVPFSFH